MRFHHYGLEVQDLQASTDFYMDLLGLMPIRKLEFMDEKLVFLASEGFQIELISKRSKTCLKRSSHVHICIETARLEEMISKFSERGYPPAEGPYLLENGWKIVFYEGPDHEVIEFLEVP
jgi:lactoylglutathione lyase